MINIGGYSKRHKHEAQKHIEHLKELTFQETFQQRQKIKDLSRQTNEIRKRFEHKKKTEEKLEEERKQEILNKRKLKQKIATEKFQRHPPEIRKSKRRVSVDKNVKSVTYKQPSGSAESVSTGLLYNQQINDLLSDNQPNYAYSRNIPFDLNEAVKMPQCVNFSNVKAPIETVLLAKPRSRSGSIDSVDSLKEQLHPDIEHRKVTFSQLNSNSTQPFIAHKTQDVEDKGFTTEQLLDQMRMQVLSPRKPLNVPISSSSSFVSPSKTTESIKKGIPPSFSSDSIVGVSFKDSLDFNNMSDHKSVGDPPLVHDKSSEEELTQSCLPPKLSHQYSNFPFNKCPPYTTTYAMESHSEPPQTCLPTSQHLAHINNETFDRDKSKNVFPQAYQHTQFFTQPLDPVHDPSKNSFATSSYNNNKGFVRQPSEPGISPNVTQPFDQNKPNLTQFSEPGKSPFTNHPHNNTKGFVRQPSEPGKPLKVTQPFDQNKPYSEHLFGPGNPLFSTQPFDRNKPYLTQPTEPSKDILSHPSKQPSFTMQPFDYSKPTVKQSSNQDGGLSMLPPDHSISFFTKPPRQSTAFSTFPPKHPEAFFANTPGQNNALFTHPSQEKLSFMSPSDDQSIVHGKANFTPHSKNDLDVYSGSKYTSSHGFETSAPREGNINIFADSLSATETFSSNDPQHHEENPLVSTKPPPPPPNPAVRRGRIIVSANAKKRAAKMADKVKEDAGYQRSNTSEITFSSPDVKHSRSLSSNGTLFSKKMQNKVVDKKTGIRLDKTPTDDEINELWENVRECLSSEPSPHEKQQNSNLPLSGRNKSNLRRVNSRDKILQRQNSNDSMISVNSYTKRHALLPQRAMHLTEKAKPIFHHNKPVVKSKESDMSESMASFLALEELCSQPSPRHSKAIFKPSKRKEKKQNEWENEGLSALSIEEKCVLQSIERLDRQLKKQQAKRTKLKVR